MLHKRQASEDQMSSSDEEEAEIHPPSKKVCGESHSSADNLSEASTEIALAEQESKCDVFRFSDLPAELRLAIYELCLVDEEGVNVKRSYRSGSHTERDREPDMPDCTKELSPNLLRVNKAIYREAGPVLYENNIIFDDKSTFHTFIGNLGSQARSWIRDLTIREYGTPGLAYMWRSYAEVAFTSLIEATNLRRLHIDVWDPANLGGIYHGILVDGFDHSPEQFSQEMSVVGHRWLDAVARENGSAAAPVALISTVPEALQDLECEEAERWREYFNCLDQDFRKRLTKLVLRKMMQEPPP